MKKIKFIRPAFITLLTASMMFVACQKSDDTLNSEEVEVQQATLTAEADAEADVLFNDVFDNVMGVNAEVGLSADLGVFGRPAVAASSARFTGVDSTPHCLTVTITPLAAGAFPKTVTLDFGTGCLGRDGHIRKGKIIITYTGRMVVPGSKATTHFDGFYTDSVKVEGTHIIQNNSTSNNRIFSVRVENGKLSKPSGNYIAWNENKTRTQIEGNGTPNFARDDIFNITGTGSGTVKRGDNTVQWSVEIIEPVTRKFTCRWAVKGIIRLTRNTKTSLLDYGNGSCDDQATLTINGNIHSITLH